jgi:ElaA protein
MSLEFRWSRLETLTALELHALLMARESVFVVEQRCAYQEVDALDLHAWHLRVFKDGEFAASARVVDAGYKYPQPSIGRVMTLPAFRGERLGRALMQEAIRFTEQHYPHTGIQISAQAHLHGFYASLGFVTVGAAYDEDGIPHIGMLKAAAM